MKLISCTEFVKEKSDYYNSACWVDDFSVLNETFNRIKNYAEFLKQPLTLSMLVPCNDKGDVLSNPVNSTLQSQKRIEEWEQAKENVIFEGCELITEYENSWLIGYEDNAYSILKDFTIEDLIDLNLTITPTAINKYKLK